MDTFVYYKLSVVLYLINIQEVCTILNRRYSNARTDLAHVCVFILIVLSLAFDHHANQRVAKALLNRFAAA